jgi:hypothetical protein
MADEPYLFYRITCSPEVGYFEIQRDLIYNIGDYVWPANDKWQSHIQNLKRLEKRHGLYTLQDLYGYDDGQPIVCTLPSTKIRIDYKRAFRNREDGGQAYRTDPVLRIQPFVSIHLDDNAVNRVRLTVNKDDYVLELCTQFPSGGLRTIVCKEVTAEKDNRKKPINNETFQMIAKEWETKITGCGKNH